MALVEVIKWEVSTSELVHKYQVNDLKLGSQLVVYPSQTAFFVKGGQILYEFICGTYTIKSENIPLLSKLTNLPFGGESPFQAEVWFVNQVSLLDCKWGTPSPIQIEDPKYGVIVPIRAFGQYGFHISNPRLFLEKFVGNMPSFATQKVSDYFRGVILSKLTNIITEKLYADNLSVVNINNHVEAIGAYAKEKLAEVLNEYGITLEMFQTIAISVDENDASFKRLKETKDSLARINIMGKENYQMERSFDVLEGAAENNGGLAGAAVGIGAGLGIGKQIGDIVNQNLNVAPQEMPPLPRISFYVGVNGQPQGPFDLAVLRNACQGGQYSATTLVWRKGMTEWKQMSEVPEFADIFEDCPPPLPQI